MARYIDSDGDSVFQYRRKRGKIRIFDLYIQLICLMPIVAMLQGVVDAVNRIVFICIFIVQLYLMIRKLSFNRLCFYVVAFLAYILVLFNTKNLRFDNNIVYFMNWLIYAQVMLAYRNQLVEWISNNERFIRRVMWVWTAIVVVSLPFPSSYFIQEGGARYFGSFVGSSFRLCPTALFIESLALCSVVFFKRKKDVWFCIVPLFCGFMGSSRTYFAVLVIVFLVAFYMACKTKKEFFQKVVPVAIVGLLAFANSSLSDKIAHTLDSSQYDDFWFRITSSRSVIWARIVRGYNNQSIYYKIFGGGFGFSNSVAKHYAHNDFIEILANHGILGLSLYLLSMIMLFKGFFRGKKVGPVAITCCVLVWLINAVFNMFYWYICAALCLPFMLVAVSIYYGKRLPEQ